jgi:hypothetical protein
MRKISYDKYNVIIDLHVIKIIREEVGSGVSLVYGSDHFKIINNIIIIRRRRREDNNNKIVILCSQ